MTQFAYQYPCCESVDSLFSSLELDRGLDNLNRYIYNLEGSTRNPMYDTIGRTVMLCQKDDIEEDIKDIWGLLEDLSARDDIHRCAYQWTVLSQRAEIWYLVLARDQKFGLDCFGKIEDVRARLFKLGRTYGWQTPPDHAILGELPETSRSDPIFPKGLIKKVYYAPGPLPTCPKGQKEMDDLFGDFL